MMPLRWMVWGLLCAALGVGASVQAQDRRDAIVNFKDGFYIKGRVKEQAGKILWDPASGRPIPLLSGEFHIDDEVRLILFSPTNVQKVEQLKRDGATQPLHIKRLNVVNQRTTFPPTWTFDDYSKWSDKGVRTLRASTDKGASIEMTQKMHTLSSQWIYAVTADYAWSLMFYPQELGPEVVRPILVQSFNDLPGLKELKESQKYLQIAKFQQEAGWYEEAEKELVSITNAFPADRKVAQVELDKLRKVRAELFVESIEKAAQVGQPLEAMERLATFDRQGAEKIVSPEHRLKALDLKAKYDKAKTDVEQATTYLKELRGLTKWLKSTDYILEELNHDTVGRLETFLVFAEQFHKNRKEQKKQQQTAEEVLALAVTSWLQSAQAAEPDTKTALKLARARLFLLEYLQATDERDRANLLSAFKRVNDLPMDVLVKLVRMLPPSAPHDAKNLDTKVQTIKVEVPESDGGSYLVQLPPDYHHQRSYPVLMLLHGGRDNAEDTLKRFTEEGAKHGFILAAPILGGKGMLKGKQPAGGAKANALVCDTLRDLRRRFNVDSDRVFLFGFENGGSLAFDVALGHPDLFAGVVPMCGSISPFTRRFYWPNAQYVPFYIIDGGRNGDNPKQIRELIKDRWSRDPYACIYVEYKGRTCEWFSEEVPRMMQWMSRKKRHTPMKEVGRANPGVGGLWEEFRSTRSTDNSFYWLRAGGIDLRCRSDHAVKKWPVNFAPASLQATLAIENKSDKDGEARIFTKAHVRFTGLDAVTLWITPGMMDLTKPVALYVNGQPQGGLRAVPVSVDTLVDELYQSGDRQRVFVAKIDIKK